MKFLYLACWLALTAPQAARAADIELLVGFAPGQGADMAAGPDAASEATRRLTSETTYDDAGRFYAENLGRFLPGSPRVTARLLPGAGSLLAANRLASASGEGAVLALLGPRSVFEPLIDPQNARWLASDFHWIGALSRDDGVCVARNDAHVAGPADIRTHEVFTAALAPGSRSFVYARALNELGGARLKIISGYGGAFEATRALETGEVQAWCGWTMNTLLYSRSSLLRDGELNPFVRFTVETGVKPTGMPAASAFASSVAERAAMRAVASQTRFGAFALAASPATPEKTVDALRSSFLAMLRDPGVLQAAAQRGMIVDPVPGAELQALAAELNELDAGAREKLRTILSQR